MLHMRVDWNKKLVETSWKILDVGKKLKAREEESWRNVLHVDKSYRELRKIIGRSKRGEEVGERKLKTSE